jgi:uncharacterized membrane protein
MKTLKIRSLIGFAVVLFLLLLPVQVLALSISFPSVVIDAVVQEDGSMLITEQRTTAIRGTAKGLNTWIQTQPPIRITDVTVEENGVPFTYIPGDQYGPTGTYITIEEPGRFFVDWSIAATDETRTFTLRYLAENVVQVHQDTAELYYQFVGDGWDARSDQVLVRLHLPAGATTDDIRAWGHGPLHGDVTIQSGNLVTWEISPLPARTFLEGRVTFPTSLVPQATHQTGRIALPDILAEEQNLADLANRERQGSILLWISAALILLGSIAMAFFIWLRYGKEYKPSFDGDYFRDLPADYTPAELGVLWRFGKPAPEDLTATLIDLARRGHLRLEEFIPEKRSLLGGKKMDYRMIRQNKDEKLAIHEQKLMDFLFTQVTLGRQELGQQELTFTELEAYAKKNQSRYHKFWQDWQYTLAARGVTHNFFDHDVSTGKMIGVGIGVIMLPLGFLAANVLTPALILGGLILAGTGVILRRRSRTGVEDFVRWRAFRRFLLHFSELHRQEIPSLVIWEHYLVYAVSLGVAKEVIKQLQLVYPQMESGGHRFGGSWWYFHSSSGPASFGNMTNSFDNFTGQITQSFRTATSTPSSGSGRGGGFSGGGGGGGFGGGGGGAR